MHASHDIGCYGIAAYGLGYAETRDLNLAVLGYHDILRLDIPVYYMIIMGRLYTHRYLDSYTCSFLNGKSGLLLYILFERDTLYKLHNYVLGAALFAHIIYIDYIRMHHAGSRLSLRTEFGHKISVLRKFLFEHLDSHKPVKLMILSLIYVRHTAGTDLLEDLIALPEHHAYLYHLFSYTCDSMSTTAILSFPPLLLAAATRLSAFSTRSLCP